MAFTVETGSGVAGANSYLSVADADSYWTDRAGDYAGLATAWAAAATAAKQASLIRASQYLDGHYTWGTGEKNTSTQGLGWPRSDAYDREGWTILSTVVPQPVKDACAELAARDLAATLGGGDQRRERSSEQVEGIAVSYVRGSPAKSYPVVDDLLRGLVTGRGSAKMVLC
jgi:hypothetical protein